MDWDRIESEWADMIRRVQCYRATRSGPAATDSTPRGQSRPAAGESPADQRVPEVAVHSSD